MLMRAWRRGVIATAIGAVGASMLLADRASAQGGDLGDLQEVSAFNGLEAFPIYATVPPGQGDRILVVYKSGRIRSAVNGVLQTTLWMDIVARTRSTESERGLLGLAFDKDYNNPGTPGFNRIFVNYTTNARSAPSGATLSTGTTVVSSFRLVADRSRVDNNSEQILLTIAQPFDNHNGGCMHVGPDGMLYIMTGDGGSGNDPQNTALNPNSLLGKLLRIDPSSDDFPTDPDRNYAIPPGNAFPGGVGGRPEVYFLGLRNAWRWSFDRATNDLYIGDVGQDAREEINFVPDGTPPGRNFGWRVREGNASTGLSDGGFPPAPGTLVEPVWVGLHSDATNGGQSITGGYAYRGTRIPAWRGRYFFADFVNFGAIYSFRMRQGVAEDFRKHDVDFNTNGLNVRNVASWGEDPNTGDLFLVRYSGTASFTRLYRLVASGPQPARTDLTADGSINDDDLGLFITLYFQGDHQADYNMDNSLNDDDLGEYLTAYFAS